MGEMGEEVPLWAALDMMGMTRGKFRGLCQRFPDLVPVYSESDKPWVSVYDLWAECRWVVLGDVARTLGIGQATVVSWVKVHNLLSSEKRPFRHNSVCIPYDQVRAMEVRLRVKELVGRGKTTPWAEIDAWVAMGPEAIMREAARQAVDQLGELEFDELT